MRRILDPVLDPVVARLMALPIAAKLWLGFGTLLVLLCSLSLAGWFALGTQSERAALAERAGQMTSGLRLVRQDEKNFMLRGEPVYVEQVDSALAELRQDAAAIRAEVSGANAERMQTVEAGLQAYKGHFDDYVDLRRRKQAALAEMVRQGREVETLAARMRADQKSELERLEAESVAASAERRDKWIKADDANRIIKLMGEARQHEKNYLLRRDADKAAEVRNLVGELIAQAETLRERFADAENRKMAEQIAAGARAYLDEFEDVVAGRGDEDAALAEMVRQGRAVETLAERMRADQKAELERLERRSQAAGQEFRDKRVKADDANRIIKLMDEARQQEKNYLVQASAAHANETRDLVETLIGQAQTTRQRFADPENRAMAEGIAGAARTYLSEFEDVVDAEQNQGTAAQAMVEEARTVEAAVGAVRDSLFDAVTAGERNALALIAGVAALSLGFGVLAAASIAMDIRRPIRGLVGAMDRLATDDTDVEVPSQRRSDEIGVMARAVQVFKDAMIARRAAEARASRYKAESAAKTRFLGAMSHDLRTPLNAVRGYSDFIRTAPYGALGHPKYDEYVDHISEAADALTNLVGRVLEYARLESGAIKPEPTLVDVQDAIEKTAAMTKQARDRHDVTVDVTGIETGLTFSTDRVLLGQVVMNVLDNAVKFSPDDGTIAVTAWLDRQDGLHVSVADQGPGIPENRRQRVFEPFYTEDHMIARDTKGFGLGLATVKAITRELGGRVDLFSDGPGTRVEVCLPEPGSAPKSAGSDAGETSHATAEPRSWSFRPGLGMGDADTPQARRVGGGDRRDRRRHAIV